MGFIDLGHLGLNLPIGRKVKRPCYDCVYFQDMPINMLKPLFSMDNSDRQEIWGCWSGPKLCK